MKRLFFIIALALIPFVLDAAPAGKQFPRQKIISLMNEYKDCEGFEMVKVGSLGTSLLRSVITLSADSEDRDDLNKLFSTVKGVKKVLIVDFDDCNSRIRSEINRKLGKILKDTEILMEAKDDDDMMTMYAVVDENSGIINDFVLYSPSENSIICVFGKIDLAAIKALTEN